MNLNMYEIYVEKTEDWPDYIYYRETLEEAKSLANHQHNYIRAEVRAPQTREVIYVKKTKKRG